MLPKILAVIPARYASTRFPGKPLVDIQGKTMIQRVYEQAIQVPTLAGVIVATDDERIATEVRRFGGQVNMTDPAHRSGTERLTEVAAHHPDATHFLNIQGDEPFVPVSQLTQLAETLLQEDAPLATLAQPLRDPDRLLSPHVVKVVVGVTGQALYFSRHPIPFLRDHPDPTHWLQHQAYYQHIGLYGYRRDVLLQYPHLPPSELEQAESLEQLRWLAHGYAMQVGITAPHEEAIAIDTPEDLARLQQKWAQGG